MRRARFGILGVWVLGLPLLACAIGSDADERMLDEGDWAWVSEDNCSGATRVVRIQGSSVSWLEDGAVVRRGLQLERTHDRRGAVSTGSGRIDGVLWSYVELGADGVSQEVTEAYTARFTIGSRRLQHLILERRQVNGARDYEYPYLRERLIKCPTEPIIESVPG